MADWIDVNAVTGEETNGARRREGAAALLSLASRCPLLRQLRLAAFNFGPGGVEASKALVVASSNLDVLEELTLARLPGRTDYDILFPLLTKLPNLRSLVTDVLPLIGPLSTAAPVGLPPLRRLRINIFIGPFISSPTRHEGLPRSVSCSQF